MRLLQNLLEEEATVRHHALAGLHAGHDRDMPILLQADLDFAAGKSAVAF